METSSSPPRRAAAEIGRVPGRARRRRGHVARAGARGGRREPARGRRRRQRQQQQPRGGGGRHGSTGSVIAISNEWERSAGRRVGEGYTAFERVVEIHHPTRLTFGDDAFDEARFDFVWSIDLPSRLTRGAAPTCALRGREVEHTFAHVGAHRVRLR